MADHSNNGHATSRQSFFGSAGGQNGDCARGQHTQWTEQEMKRGTKNRMCTKLDSNATPGNSRQRSNDSHKDTVRHDAVQGWGGTARQQARRTCVGNVGETATCKRAEITGRQPPPAGKRQVLDTHGSHHIATRVLTPLTNSSSRGDVAVRHSELPIRDAVHPTLPNGLCETVRCAARTAA